MPKCDFNKVALQNLGKNLLKKETYTAKEMKFPIKDFFSKRDQIHSFLMIWSQLLMKSLMKNFIFLHC